MKKICILLLLAAFQTAILQAEPEATKDKITRDEAQHIALEKVPGGSVKSASLKRENGRGIWAVAITKKGSDVRTEIHVDAATGHIVPIQEPASPAEGREEKPKR